MEIVWALIVDDTGEYLFYAVTRAELVASLSA
jgi:hypothetical protein